MNAGLAAVIGFVVGAVLVYWWFRQLLDKQKAEFMEQSRRIAEETERSFQQRMQSTVSALQADYDKQLKAARAAAISAPTVTEVPAAPAPTPVPTPPPTPAPVVAAPEPTSVVAPVVPAVVAAPVTLPVSLSAVAQIQAWGTAGQVSAIPSLSRYAIAPDSETRQQVAIALGQIASRAGLRAEVQTSLGVLAKLSRDADPAVRCAAVDAIAQFPSPQAIALLQPALRDSAAEVVQAASAGLNRLKGVKVSVKGKAKGKR